MGAFKRIGKVGAVKKISRLNLVEYSDGDMQLEWGLNFRAQEVEQFVGIDERVGQRNGCRGNMLRVFYFYLQKFRFVFSYIVLEEVFGGDFKKFEK